METLPLQKAVTIAGGQAALAKKIGTKQQHIWWWLNRSKKVPAERCGAIERATGGRVTRYDLREDVFGPAPFKPIPVVGTDSPAIVDSEDYDRIAAYAWYAVMRGGNKDSQKIYAECCKKTDGSRFQIMMHRLVMGIPEGMVVDHINGNPLDNRKINLRICTQTENSRNRKASGLNTSGFKGVAWRPDIKKWRARIMVGRKEISLGVFDTPEEAAKAYNDAAIKHFGSFAKLNIFGPDPSTDKAA